jgi:hypothetical protein
MPRPRQPTEQITLDLTGSKIEADKFRKAVFAFLDLIDDVAKEVTGRGDAVRWIITVHEGSVRLSASPEANRADVPVRLNQVTHAIRSGVRLIENRALRPRFFLTTLFKESERSQQPPMAVKFKGLE